MRTYPSLPTYSQSLVADFASRSVDASLASGPITLAFPAALSRDDRKEVHETAVTFSNLTSKTIKHKVVSIGCSISTHLSNLMHLG